MHVRTVSCLGSDHIRQEACAEKQKWWWFSRTTYSTVGPPAGGVAILFRVESGGNARVICTVSELVEVDALEFGTGAAVALNGALEGPAEAGWMTFAGLGTRKPFRRPFLAGGAGGMGCRASADFGADPPAGTELAGSVAGCLGWRASAG